MDISFWGNYSYIIQESVPEISLKIYHGDYEGLVRIEVEFEHEELARQFVSPPWFGEEITDSPLGKDSKLITLSPEEFRNELS